MNKFNRIFERNLEGIVSNSHPCNNPEDIEATIAINMKMEKIESEFRSKSIMSKMATRDFVYRI